MRVVIEIVMDRNTSSRPDRTSAHSPKGLKTDHAHDDSLENHRRYNRRLGVRRLNGEQWVGVECRQYEKRRILDHGYDRRGSGRIHTHYVHSVII